MNPATPSRYAVLVNLAANDGRAAARWESISREVLERLPPDTLIHHFRPPENVESLVRVWLDQGVDAFISAGGDGSANYLLNLLMRHSREHAEQLWLGGIGLGSSNDFVKPKQHFIQELPVRLDVENRGPGRCGQSRMANRKRRNPQLLFYGQRQHGRYGQCQLAVQPR
jgi:hypothetical protein